METMKIKREQGILETAVSEANHSRVNVSNTNLYNDTIDLDPPSPTINVPLSRIFSKLQKDLPPSPSTKTTKKPDDDVVEPVQQTIQERVGELVQHRIDVCKNLSVDHWLRRAFLKPL